MTIKFIASIITGTKNKKTRIILFVTGLCSLIWFLIRVIPKPSRAAYPCQRAAFPIASSFVLWVTGSLLARKTLKKGLYKFSAGKNITAVILVVSATCLFFISIFALQFKDTVIGAVDQHFSSRSAEKFFNEQLVKNNQSIIIPGTTVSIVKSERANASELNFTDIDNLVREAVDLEGSFDDIIHEGDVVIIKPNVVTSRASGVDYSDSYPKEANGVATDYRIVQVVVNMVRERNRTGKIVLLEGSGFGITRRNLERLGYNEITGLDSVICLDENILKWYDPQSRTLVKASLPADKNLYSEDNEYFLNKFYYEADVVISLPTLKSHFVAGISGAVKNVGLGAAPVEMYGMGNDAGEDLRVGRWEHIDHGDFLNNNGNLDKWIHDFYLCKPVDYVIMDGLQGVEYGPYPGSHSVHTLQEVQKNMRIIIAGHDAIAVDAIEALVTGFDPYLINHLVYLAKDSAGFINPAFIRVKGVQVHEIKTDFKEDMPGRQFKYSDFTPPVDAAVLSWEITGGKIHISLNPGQETIKAEISYDNIFLDQTIINDFESFYLQLPVTNPDFNKIKVYVYDRYLNCTVLSLDSSTLIHNEQNKSFKIYPNPAYAYIKIDLPDDFINGLTYRIYSSDGRLVLNGLLNAPEGETIDVSSLIPGIYTVLLSTGSSFYTSKMLKINY